MEKGGAQAPVNCDLCETDSAIANWKCRDCQQKLCDPCHAYHLKLAGTKHHTIVTLAESYAQNEGQNIALKEDGNGSAGKTTAIAGGTKHPKIAEILKKIEEKEKELSTFDKVEKECEDYRSNYDQAASENKDEIAEDVKRLRENLNKTEKEMLTAVDSKAKTDKSTIEKMMKENKELKEKHGKQIKYIKRLLTTLQDVEDESTIEQFTKDTLPKLEAITVPTFAVSRLPKPLKIKTGKETIQSVIGSLVEDTRFDSDQKKAYRNELKFELKFKPEKGNSSIYSIQLRPDGKAWVTTYNYRVYLVLRSGHIQDEISVKFLPIFCTVNRYGHLYCSSGKSELHVIQKNGTVTEFENLAPYFTYGLFMNAEDQLFVCLQKSDSPGKIAVFADTGMLLREICLDTTGEPMFSLPKYVTMTSSGIMCVVDNENLVVVDPSGTSSKKYKPEKDWIGKCIITDPNGNLLSAVCPLEFVPLPIHVTNVEGRVIKHFTVEGPGISGINALAIDEQYDEPVLWIGTPNGHVIIAQFLDT
ncbi:uncharacterized protein LOC144622191 [Crassostrea virginica]